VQVPHTDEEVSTSRCRWHHGAQPIHRNERRDRHRQAPEIHRAPRRHQRDEWLVRREV